MTHRVLALLIAGVLLALTPVAHASPPDQTWIPGLYDDADYDDIVLVLMSTVGASDGALLVPVGPRIEVLDIVLSRRSSRPAAALRIPYHRRAPPLA